MASSAHLYEGVSTDPVKSPGPVSGDEYLIREMCNPCFFDDNDNITETALPLDHLRTLGVSVHRREYSSIELVKNSVQNRCRNREDWKEWVSLLTAEEVRAIPNNGKQAFCIIDDPTPENPAHANIVINCPENRAISKAYARKMRVRLLPHLQNPMTVEEAFQPS